MWRSACARSQPSAPSSWGPAQTAARRAARRWSACRPGEKYEIKTHTHTHIRTHTLNLFTIFVYSLRSLQHSPSSLSNPTLCASSRSAFLKVISLVAGTAAALNCRRKTGFSPVEVRWKQRMRMSPCDVRGKKEGLSEWVEWVSECEWMSGWVEWARWVSEWVGELNEWVEWVSWMSELCEWRDFFFSRIHNAPERECPCHPRPIWFQTTNL